jgi:hypothetical protein|tara:strand:+ start:72 stop:482 length:411 start_codon:yes stop_codon:yes gene_type:complete
MNKSKLKFIKLDGEINASTPEQFIEQYRGLLSTKIGRELRSIVYKWCTQNPVPRMRGESPIIYIGMTINSIFDRHHKYAKIESSGDNWKRSEHIIKNYGPITVECAKCDNPKETEKKLLQKYFDNHFEFPPVNCSS